MAVTPRSSLPPGPISRQQHAEVLFSWSLYQSLSEPRLPLGLHSEQPPADCSLLLDTSHMVSFDISYIKTKVLDSSLSPELGKCLLPSFFRSRGLQWSAMFLFGPRLPRCQEAGGWVTHPTVASWNPGLLVRRLPTASLSASCPMPPPPHCLVPLLYSSLLCNKDSMGLRV